MIQTAYIPSKVTPWALVPHHLTDGLLRVLHLPLDHLRRESRGLADGEVPLVPRRVVPHIFFNEFVDVIELTVE